MKLSNAVRTYISPSHNLNSKSTPPSTLLAVLFQPQVLNPILPDYRLYQTFWLPPTRLLCVPSSVSVTCSLSLFRTSSIIVALRQLTGKGRTFLWLLEHQVEFDKLKTILSSNLVVRHFDHTKPVYLLTDASRLFGLGYALGHIKTDTSGKEIFKIMHCGSKGLKPTQQWYSTIEL